MASVGDDVVVIRKGVSRPLRRHHRPEEYRRIADFRKDTLKSLNPKPLFKIGTPRGTKNRTPGIQPV